MGNMPHTSPTTSIKHRALTLTLRTPQCGNTVWGKRKSGKQNKKKHMAEECFSNSGCPVSVVGKKFRWGRVPCLKFLILFFLLQKQRKKVVNSQSILEHVFGQTSHEELRQYVPPIVEIIAVFAGSLEVKLPTMQADEIERSEEPGKSKAE